MCQASTSPSTSCTHNYHRRRQHHHQHHVIIIIIITIITIVTMVPTWSYQHSQVSSIFQSPLVSMHCLYAHAAAHPSHTPAPESTSTLNSYYSMCPGKVCLIHIADCQIRAEMLFRRLCCVTIVTVLFMSRSFHQITNHWPTVCW